MALINQLQVQFKDEIAFNEQLDTFDYAIPVIADPSLQFPGDKADNQSLQTRLFKNDPGWRTPRGPGQISFKVVSGGAQVDTATGALVATALHKLLSDGLGGSDTSQVGGVAGAAASATAMASATGTRTRGSLIRVGQAGDGKAEGQATVIGDPDTALLVGLPAAPGATDKIRACMVAYPKETPGTTKRFLCRYSHDPATQYIFSGCQLAMWSIEYSPGMAPIETYTYSFAYWRQVSGIADLDLEQNDPAPSSGGSFILQDVGTATRPTTATELEAAEMSLTLSLGLIERVGEVPGLPLCKTIGWARNKGGSRIPGTLTIAYPFDDVRLPEFEYDGADTKHKHFLWTSSAGEGSAHTEGRHIVLYIPDMYMVKPPTIKDVNGLTYQESVYALTEGPDDTSDLTLSFFRFGRS